MHAGALSSAGAGAGRGRHAHVVHEGLHDLTLERPVVLPLDRGDLPLQAEQERGCLGEPGFERSR